MREEIDQRLFNKAMDIAEAAIDRGYAKAWFAWIEWVTLTSVLLLAAKSTGSIITMVAGIVSVIVLFFVALVAVKRSIYEQLENIKHKGVWVLLLVFVLIIGTPAIAMSIINAVLKTLNTSI